MIRNLWITFLNLLGLAVVLYGGYIIIGLKETLPGLTALSFGCIIMAISLIFEKPTGDKTQQLKGISKTFVLGSFIVVIIGYLIYFTSGR